MRIAAAYNKIVGATISHFDVMNWGQRDEIFILNALNYVAAENKPPRRHPAKRN